MGSVSDVGRQQARRVLDAVGLRVRRVRPGSWLVGRGGDDVDQVADAVGLVLGDQPPVRVQRQLGTRLAEHEIQTVLARTGANVVLDVGANRGQFAGALRARGYTGRIVSFEPIPEHLAVLRRRSADDPDWMVLPYAAGDADGSAEINEVPGTMSSLLNASDFGRGWSQRLGRATVRSIEVRRIEGLLEQALAGVSDPRVFLKLDTQGYDLIAFRGVGEAVKSLVGLVSEVSCVPIYDGMPRLVEQVAEYEAAGFELAGMYPVTIHQPTLRVIEFDAVMVRAEAVHPTH